MNELNQRISRLYAAVKAVCEEDPQKLRARIVQTPKFFGMYHDFRGGMTDSELLNLTHSLIANIANLHDHLKHWMRSHNLSTDRVEGAVANSEDLKLIMDLHNREKHGGESRNGGRSMRSPRLANVERVMRLQARGKGSGIAMIVRADGTPDFHGDGSAGAVITGDVVDHGGARVGELYDIAMRAVTAWEQLFSECRLMQTAQ